jgi:hypothetical protein
MQTLQPRTLSNSELIRISADMLARYDEMSPDFQQELLRRFTALAPLDEFPPRDPNQLDLFK